MTICTEAVEEGGWKRPRMMVIAFTDEEKLFDRSFNRCYLMTN
jgi:hypothetical protein